MKFNLKFYVWVSLLIIFGILLLYIALIIKADIPIYALISFVLLVLHYPLTEYWKRKRINKLKKDLKINGDVPLEELENKRIEKEYRDVIGESVKRPKRHL